MKKAVTIHKWRMLKTDNEWEFLLKVLSRNVGEKNVHPHDSTNTLKDIEEFLKNLDNEKSGNIHSTK